MRAESERAYSDNNYIIAQQPAIWTRNKKPERDAMENSNYNASELLLLGACECVFFEYRRWIKPGEIIEKHTLAGSCGFALK
jgi:hypothetical protein